MLRRPIVSCFAKSATGGRNFIGRTIVGQLRIVVLAAAALLGGSVAADAGPCTAQISQVEQQIRRLQEASPPGGAGEPSGPQSVGAQLHHQPTPQSVESAESKAKAGSAAALDRARKADAAGNASACSKALREAKLLYGLD